MKCRHPSAPSMRAATALEPFACPEHWNDKGIGGSLSPILNDYGSEYGEQLEFMNVRGKYHIGGLEKDTAV